MSKSDHSWKYKGNRQRRPNRFRRKSSNAARILSGGVLIGALIGWGSIELQSVKRRIDGAKVDRSSEKYFSRCAEARSAGVAPIYRGEPGYRNGLDADGDGIACEPYRGY